MAVKKRKSAGAKVKSVVKKAKASRAKKSTVKRVARKSTRAAARSTPCNVKPVSLGPFTFPAQGGTFEIFVTYPTPPNPCPYTAKSRVRWIKTNPRISEFDAILAPNPGPARQGIVVVQGAGNTQTHKVVIRQMSPS